MQLPTRFLTTKRKLVTPPHPGRKRVDLFIPGSKLKSPEKSNWYQVLLDRMHWEFCGISATNAYSQLKHKETQKNTVELLPTNWDERDRKLNAAFVLGSSLAIKDIMQIIGKIWKRSAEEAVILYQWQLPDFVVMQKNAVISRKYSPEYLGIKGHHIYNVFSNNLEKVCVYIYYDTVYYVIFLSILCILMLYWYTHKCKEKGHKCDKTLTFVKCGWKIFGDSVCCCWNLFVILILYQNKKWGKKKRSWASCG